MEQAAPDPGQLLQRAHLKPVAHPNQHWARVSGRNAMNMQETSTSVLMDSLWRQHSESELLRNYLLVYYSHIVVPSLPEKKEDCNWKETVNVTGFQLKRFTELKHCSDELQSSAGHHMDVHASSVDDILENKEHYADQLKGYPFHTEYDLEMAAKNLASKKQQHEELGMTIKLFGQENPEQREARIKMLEERISEGEQQLKSKSLEKQKSCDLKEAFISFGIHVWTNAKECFSKM
ncbi:hypothetical protein FD755_010118 [Muntiacus reevesi]|uniref:Uncharacterized protein n=1 Tax=Muntiacus reevesi TaxID=9886 RepID=A0A5N3XX82_MUNRE|nr:hypothetical protein FD755_010118 [Muntiacus reevesi]